MGMAQLVVAAVLVEGRSKSEVARPYGVSRRWVITLVQRYLAEGEAGLAPRSRRPRRSPNRISVELEDEIIEIRKELAKAGYEAGAATIAFHLERRHSQAPAVSTIWRVLTGRYRRRGRVTLEVTRNERGIRYTHSRLYHPQTCGKVERFHQTLKRWLATQPPAQTITELQAQLDRFRRYCNTARPHRALGRRTPTEAYHARPKAIPTGTKLDDAGWRARPHPGQGPTDPHHHDPRRGPPRLRPRPQPDYQPQPKT